MSNTDQNKVLNEVEKKLRDDLTETFPAGSFDLFLNYLNQKYITTSSADVDLNISLKENISKRVISLGSSVLSKTKEVPENVSLVTASGYGSLAKLVEGKYIVAQGLYSFSQSKKVAGSVGIGDSAGYEATNSMFCTFVGISSGRYLKTEYTSLGDIREVSPIMIGKFGSESWLNNFIKDDYSDKIAGGFGCTYVGAFSGMGSGVDRGAFSIHIGTRIRTGVYRWRDYNNIIIGNELATNHANSQIWNSIIIGNFFRTWRPNSTDNILAIHNPKSTEVEVTNALLYGEFDKRLFKVNGKFVLNINYSNAEGDRSYTKKVVAKPDGTLGLVEDEDQNKIITKILKEDYTPTENLEFLDVFTFNLKANKIYKLELGLLGDIRALSRVIVTDDVAFLSLPAKTLYLDRMGFSFRIVNQIDESSNDFSYGLGYYNDNLYVSGVIRPTRDCYIKIGVKKFNSVPDGAKLLAGTYARIEEIR